MVNHCCCAYNCSNSTQKQKNYLKYPELKGITFHSFPVDDRKKTFVSGMNESERRKRWIAACHLSTLNVTRHTRICSAHFEGGLGPTKLNPTPTIFSFPSHLQTKTHRERTDPEERRQKSLCLQNRSQTAPQEKEGKAKKGKENEKPKAKRSRPEESAFSSEMSKSAECETEPATAADNTPPNKLGRTNDPPKNHPPTNDPPLKDLPPENPPSFVDKCTQTDLTCEDIKYMEEAKTKLEEKQELKREIFMDDVLKSNKSVHFYTGLSSHACLIMLFSFLKPLAHAMKYWDNRKRGRGKHIRYNVMLTFLIVQTFLFGI